MVKKAFITGITGQDGSYLAELLLEKGYEVHGMIRRSSTFNTARIDHLYQDPHEQDVDLKLHYGNMVDSSNISRLIEKIEPDEVYNLAAQSNVSVSYKQPEYTSDVDGLGALRVLDAIKDYENVKFLQASTSELFGDVEEIPQNENTPFNPQSPYAVAKLYAYWITKNYRNSYDLFASNYIGFNHECISQNTPLIIKDNGFISIKRPKDIRKPREKGKNKQQWALEDIQVWDGSDFVSLNYMTATKRKRDNSDFLCKTINSRHGVTEVTNHHNMLSKEGKRVKARNLKEGNKLLHGHFPSEVNKTVISNEEAKLLGMLVADGSVREEGRGKFVCNDKNKMEEFRQLWKKVSQGSLNINTYKTEYGSATGASLNGNCNYLRYIHDQMYTRDGYKRVPDRVLNSNKESKLSFLDGYNQCDGLEAGGGSYRFKNFKTNSLVLAQGLTFLIKQTTNQDYNITFEEDEEYYGYYSINFLSPNEKNKKEKLVRDSLNNGLTGEEIRQRKNISKKFINRVKEGEYFTSNHHLAKPKRAIKKYFAHEDQPEWVFDLETGSGKIMAGVGTIVVSNSPRRGKRFVTRKITRAVARIDAGLQDKLYLGNMNSKRDWGYAPEYVKAMWMMLQHDKPDDFVVATNEVHSVREFVEKTFSVLGYDIIWKGNKIDEKGIDADTGDVLVEVDEKYFRPSEVNILKGDYSKISNTLGWKPKTKFNELVIKMVEHDVKMLKEKGEIGLDYLG